MMSEIQSSKSAAFLFPGQGSQSVGMGKFLFDNFTRAKTVFEEASDAISVNMKKLCFEADEKTLALTENTQPALLTVCTATSLVIQKDFGIKASSTAGHSIGEYSSLVLSQTMKFTDAVRAVKFRGQAMQNAVPVGQGGMTAALGLNDEQTQFLCRWAEKNSGHQPVSPANYNCDGQIVISGNLEALNWLKDNFKAEIFIENNLDEAKRCKLIPLSVSAPFHCEMMKPAEDQMRAFLNSVEFNNAHISVIQNFHAQVEVGASKLKENLIRQVSAPVLWTQSMQTLKSLKHPIVIEAGNGSVLKGLLKKIDGEFFKVFSANNLDDLKLLESISSDKVLE
jgi:[acyl-carrier-protein] S-malonyltransferase